MSKGDIYIKVDKMPEDYKPKHIEDYYMEEMKDLDDFEYDVSNTPPFVEDIEDFKTYLRSHPVMKELEKRHNKKVGETSTGKGGGLRHNKGKNRLELVPPELIEGVGKVLTMGASKYADRNWELGMSWGTVIGCLKRHLMAFEKGIDYDAESGELHIDHVLTNALFLKYYYKHYPQGDDRPKPYLNMPKVGLDIDEVMADWVGSWNERWNIDERPHAWRFDPEIGERFEIMRKSGELEDFYMNLKPLIDPKDLPFEPHCYITSRPCSKETTEAWLQKHGFPHAKVWSVDENHSKVDVAKESGIDIFVDDRFENFVELNRAGICTYLFDAPHNQRYNVGYRRIKSLKELI